MKRTAGALVFLTFTLPTASWAFPASTPSSAEPGIVMRGLEREQRAPSKMESIITTPDEQSAGKGYSTAKAFALKKVVLDGSSIYSPEQVQGLYNDMLGEMVSFADLHVIAQRMTNKYRQDGYIFSSVSLPPQKVKDGIVHLHALEGHIASVKLVGNYTDRNGLIQKYADHIDTSGAANSKEIERYLLLINDLPGITAKSFIQPSREKGGGDLIINVEEKSFEGSLGADNRGSDYLGPYRATAVGAFNDVFGLHDRTTLRGIITGQTREMKFGDITHEEQIGSDGAKVTVRAAVTDTAPGGNVAAQDIEGESQMLDIEGVYPAVRSRQYNVSVLGGFNMLDSETRVTGLKTADDNVRTVRLGARFDAADSLRGVNQLDVVATQGLNGFGSSNDGLGRSRANGHHNFLKGAATLTRVQEVTGPVSLMLSGTGQVSNNPLLASEEFSVGGPEFGRGYDAGEVTGDDGYAGIAELRYGGPVDGNPVIQSYQAYTFIDYGRVHNQDVAVGLGEAGRDSLSSAGVGVRFNAVNDFSGYLELDKPLNQEVASRRDDDYRLFFSILKRF